VRARSSTRLFTEVTPTCPTSASSVVPPTCILTLRSAPSSLP
jgi:hypothetical protein